MPPADRAPRRPPGPAPGRGPAGGATPVLKRAALLLAACGVLLFFDLGSRVLSTNDETRFPLLARDILARGDWLVPHLNGAPYLNKPPLYAWLVALASWPRGAVTQSTAPIPSLVAAVGLVLLTAWIARRLLDPDAGLVAGVVTLTTYGVFTLARAPMPDMLLCLAFTAAIAAFVAAERAGRARAPLAFYALVAVAFWAKGPAGLLPVAVVLVYALAADGRCGWARVASGPGLSLLLLAVAAWWLLGLAAGRREFTERVVRTDLLGWYLGGGRLTARALTEPFAQAATVLLPWVLALPVAAAGLRRGWRAGAGDRRGLLLLLAWAAVVFVAIGVAREQRMRYYLPLCPPVAILLGAWWAGLPRGRRGAVFAGAWLVVAAGLVGWQVRAGARHNAATDLRAVVRVARNTPAPLYAVEAPELVFAFYLDRPVAVLPAGGPLERYLERAGPGYVIVADRVLPPAGPGPARKVAGGLVGGRGFSVLAKGW